MTPTRATEICNFWFGEQKTDEQTFAKEAPKWWKKDAAFDELIRSRFEEDVEIARDGDLDNWADTPIGRLSLIVLLDQFPRNIFRDSKKAFSSDGKALAFCLEGIERKDDLPLSFAQRAVFYLPLMHSEDEKTQELSVNQYSKLRDAAPDSIRASLENNLNFAKQHKAIIDRFGRYPHRNAVIGRTSTEQELKFLDEPGSSF